MQHSQRLDQKLYTLREEVRTMSRDKEQVEKVWRERLQRCQRQLQAKEDEMTRQSQYFESFKSQLQSKLKQSQDREETLQNRIYTLEKQLLDMTVTAATGIATMSPVRITAGTGTQWEEQDSLPSLRGEGEGEEEKKEDHKKQWLIGLGDERSKDKDSNEMRLQGFILSLQEDLRMLLEREEKVTTEHRALMVQLQEAQESSHFWGCKVEEMKSEIHQLNLSKVSLEEEVDELREENQRLLQNLRDSANNLPNTTSVCIQKAQISDEENPSSSPVSLVYHQDAVESSHTGPLDPSTTAKTNSLILTQNGPQTLFGSFGSKVNPSFQSLTLTTETIDEFRMGTWCYNGVLNLEESPGEDSDALREAYRCLGLGDDLDFIKEQRDRLEEALQLAQEQLKVTTQENTRLKSQIRQHQKQEETGLDEDSLKDVLSEDQFSSMEDSAMFSAGSDGLVQALNEENRALAERIQELRDHIKIREEEIHKEQLQVKEQICRLEIDGARQQQEIQEQGCLVIELTRKTEDDLNTIMNLQQKLVEYEKLKEETERKKKFGFQSKHTQTVFRKDNIDECVDIVVNCVIESDKEPQFMSDQQGQMSEELGKKCKSSENLEVSLISEQVEQLTKLVQSLKTEQEELTGRIKCQREQQKEVSQSIRVQTEEKQRLTREVWGLKEEKDHIFKSLAGLKQERELLTRAVCGVKDERDQFQRSMTGLEEEKEQLTQAILNLKKEKNTLLESLSSGTKERDKTLESIQNLQTESHQLQQAVLNLKRDKDELTHYLKSLEEQRGTEQMYINIQEECAKLQKSVSSLKDEEVRIQFSISSLKHEEHQMILLVQGLQDEHNRLQTTSPSHANMWGTEYKEQNEEGEQNNFQDESDLLMQIETLNRELEKSHDELMQSQAERTRLQSELFQSESKREEAERRASQSIDELLRVSDVSNQLEETRNKNDNFKLQMKELQNKLTGLTREKTEALSLKAQIEEQYKILIAQLKAKTVALEELNSEYITLKRDQGIKDDLSTTLVSLQTRYSDIRAKYEALLHRKNQTDLDTAPLKAKLSCLIVKCQERNNILVQMTKIMQKHGCLDYVLKQQVEQLLSDPALQSYASTFTAGLGSVFTPEIMITFEDVNNFTQDQPCPALVTPSKQKQQIRELTPESQRLGVDKGPSPTALTPTTTTFRDCTSKITHGSCPILGKKTRSPVSLSLMPEHAGEVLLSASPTVSQRDSTHSTQNRTQLLPSPRDKVRKTCGFQYVNGKAVSSPDLTRLTESSGFSSGSGSSSSLTCFGPSKRLSSPEKIMSLQEQLQKTLQSSFQAPADRRRGQRPRKCLSFSAQSLVFPPASQAQNLLNSNHYNSTTSPLHSSVSSQPTLGGTSKSENKPTTLFSAVVSRSTTVTFTPAAQTFTKKQSKANLSRASSTISSLSSSSAEPSKAKLTSSTVANKPISPMQTDKLTTKITDTIQKASSPQDKTTFLNIGPAATDSPMSKCSNRPESTASDTTGPSRSNSFNLISKMDGCRGLVSTQQICTSAKKSAGSSEKDRTPTKTKQEAPAEVRSIEVIKTVGLSSLMIGWERPPLDELGCSNGTFVYGYRVFVDGVFHKSVMSSACTKCILENVNLTVPIHISVQTLGSNGLSSSCVHATYKQTT